MAKRAGSTEPSRSVGTRIANVLGGILCIIFIPIILCNTMLIVRSYTDSDHLPMVFGYSPIIVLSGSMYPTFDAGDMIVLEKVDPETIEVGDVICYFAEEGKDTAITHRVMDVQTNEDGEPVFVTKGDANNTEDRVVVSYESVQGRYTGIAISGLGELALNLQTPIGMAVCIICPLVLIFGWDAVRRALSAKKTAKDTQGMEDELARLRAQVAEQENKETEN